MSSIWSLMSGSLFQPSLPKLKVTCPCATCWSCDTWISVLGGTVEPSGALAGTAPSIFWIWSSWVPIVARSALVRPDFFS